MNRTTFISLLLLFVLTPLLTLSQIKPSSGGEILHSIKQRKAHEETSLLKDYEVRSIGPVVMSGRITDIIVDPNNTKHFYIGFASAGIFETWNNGASFKPIFDNYGALGIGDLAISPSNPKILYAGTGENNSSRSSYSGSGIYRSNDSGQSWKHLGLTNTQHISRIIVHPTNPEIVWVASLGALYSNNKERGIYKTTNGGTTWKQTLFISENVGIVDLVIHPSNPKKLWASSWERNRKAWHFDGDGIGSAIYYSSDGGGTWTKSMKGLPENEKNGRIGLAISQSNPNVLFAVMDNQEEFKEDEEEKDTTKIILKDLVEISIDDFLKLDTKKLDTLLKAKGFPKEYTAETVKRSVKNGEYTPKDIGQYFEDANANLFNKKVKGSEIYKSEDRGENWVKVNDEVLKGVFFTYGYYFSMIRIDPNNSDVIYFAGVPLIKSIDGGKSFTRLDTSKVHVDHHALWINPNDSDHLILGNDGGLYISYDGGLKWIHMNNMRVGQFYTVAIDMEKPYNVYGGLQDNGVYKGSSRSKPNRTSFWKRIIYGDGMYVAVDPRNSDIVFTGYQFGNYYKCTVSKNKFDKVTPKHKIGEPTLRFNWRTPLIMSSHNSDVLYCGANRLYRSMDQGESWKPISKDLTTNKQPQGNVPYSTITAVSESPLKFGLIWVGTDDGNIQLSKDGGNSWKLVSKKLPRNKWISSISASPHDKKTAFMSLNGYRYDEFKTYLYKTTDYGKTWTSIKGNLPEAVVNVVLPDPINKDLIYAGTDDGAYMSLNNGSNWQRITGVPNVATYDMVVHPRDNELVIATHGRSMYVMDVKPLQALEGSKRDTAIIAFKVKDVRHHEKWGEKTYFYSKTNEKIVKLIYYIGNKNNSKDVIVTVNDKDNNEVKKLVSSNEIGFHRLKWNLQTNDDKENPEFLKKGTYKIIFSNGNSTSEIELKIK